MGWMGGWMNEWMNKQMNERHVAFCTYSAYPSGHQHRIRIVTACYHAQQESFANRLGITKKHASKSGWAADQNKPDRRTNSGLGSKGFNSENLWGRTGIFHSPYVCGNLQKFPRKWNSLEKFFERRDNIQARWCRRALWPMRRKTAIYFASNIASELACYWKRQIRVRMQWVNGQPPFLNDPPPQYLLTKRKTSRWYRSWLPTEP